MPHPYAVILGTNEIASAIAVELHRAGAAVVLSHDPLPPVIRRKMAFHDALFDDPVWLDGVVARRADTGVDIRTMTTRRDGVVITELGLLDLVVVRPLDLLIDARLQKSQITPDLRRLARLTIGLGPAFSAGANCDVAIETQPGRAGGIVWDGPTARFDGVPAPLGERGKERFIYSKVQGRWHTPLAIGTRVFKDYPIGFLGSDFVSAPFDGILRGVVRDGTEVPAGVKLLEIDPRGRDPDVSRPDERVRAIARAVGQVVLGKAGSSVAAGRW